MALTPEQAKEKAMASVKDTKQLEARIDKILVEELKSGSTEISIDAEDLFPNEMTQEYVMELYRKAGWNVKYSYNRQNDESYLVFKPKKSEYKQ